jgi:putative flippase GtrA
VSDCLSATRRCAARAVFGVQGLSRTTAKLKVVHRNAPKGALMTLTLSPPRRDALRHLMRYASVSAISTLISLTVLGVLVGIFGLPALLSNTIAVAIGTVPSFELNRRWVWHQSRRRSLFRRALPYGLLSLSGLFISSAAVHLAADATNSSSRLVHTAAVECANFGAYGALWLIQFFLCNRFLFAHTPVTTRPLANSQDARGST